MEWTPFAGLTALDENDPIGVDGGSFLIKNPRITDHLLQIGAVTHRHDGHAALPNPHVALTGAAIASAGTLAASAGFAVTYTVLDQYGGETKGAPALSLTTGPQLAPPSIAPSATVVTSAGILPAGNYYFAMTYTDGVGGETPIGPTVMATVPAGFASASIVLSALATELFPHGAAVNWRLWRSYEGQDWHLDSQGSTNTFVDAGFDPPDNPARPPANNDTGATNTLAITLPTRAQEPALASGTAINVYLAPDNSFADPCFYAQFPISAAGTTFLITSETISEGSPPHVSLSIPGASQINPDTDLLDWHWKRPVATSSALPSGAQGDVRIALDTGHPWVVLPSAGTPNAAGWTDILMLVSDPDTGGGISSIVASAGNASAALTEIEFAGSGGVSVQLVNVSGGSGVVLIGVSGAVGPQGPQGPAGATGPAGASGAPGPAGASGAAGPQGPAGSAANFVASAGTASALVGPFLGFAASGGASVQLQKSGGSAIVLISASGLQGPAGPQGTAGTPGAAGAQGPPGTGLGVGGSGAVPLISPTLYVEFTASGGATVGVTSLGGGSARVSITGGGTGGGGSPLTVEGSGGVGQVTAVTDLRVIASGGASAGVVNLGGGSAEIVIAAPRLAGGQNGVINANDLLLSGISMTTGGVITFTPGLTTEPAWVMSQAGFLVPVIYNAGSQTFSPSLPASTKYAVIGIEVDATGALSTVKGADTATQLNTGSLIASNSPATSPGKLRIADIAVWNNAGTIRFSDQTSTAAVGVNWIDRRPWARGANSEIVRTSNSGAGNDYTTTSASFVAIDSTNLAMRVECTGVPIRVGLFGGLFNSGPIGAFTALACSVDGAFPQGVDNSGWATLVGDYMEGAVILSYTPSAGSHLFVPNYRSDTAAHTSTAFARADAPLIMAIEERVRQNANNGTV